MAKHNILGQWGEEKAAMYLCDKGYTILDTDWKDGHRDIDIVAHDNNTGMLVIVEVKTRSNEDVMSAAYAVDERKVRNLVIAANKYIKTHFIRRPMRFDIITVVGTNDDNCSIDHIENAFLPPIFYRH